MKKIFLLVFTLVFILSSVPVSASAETGIMDELQAATIDGKKFDISNYPKIVGGQASLLAFQEYGYTISGPSATFRLFLYVYNKSEEKIKTDGENRITIATAFDEKGNATTYSKFKLVFIEASPDNRFLKFEVGISPTNAIVQSRKYTISEFELHYKSETNAKTSTVGSEFKFSGYTKDGNLTTERRDIKTIKRDVTYTYFRTQTSDAGVGHQNQLNSVYFTVPNAMLESEGYLSRIKIAYRKQRTTPIFVTDDDAFYNQMLGYVGKDIGEYDENVPFFMYSTNTSVANREVEYGYNYDGLYHVKNPISCLAYAFKAASANPEEVSVSFEDLILYIQNHQYASWLFEDELETKLTEKNILFTDEYNLTSYHENKSAITKIFHSVLGFPVEESYKNLEPFYYVTAYDVSLSDKEMADTLCISQDAAQDIKNKYSAATASDETIVIFRYSETDYFVETLIYEDQANQTRGNMYFAQEDIYFDWDMIELEFDLEGEKTVMPFIMSSQDQGGDITNPSGSNSVFGNDDKRQDVPDLSWIWKCIGLLLGIAVLCLALKYMNLILEFFNIFSKTISNKNDRRDKP